MLACRAGLALVFKLCQSAANAEAGVTRFDNIIHVAVFGCLVGIGKEVVVFLFLLCEESLGIFVVFGLFGAEDGYSAAGAHYGYFGRRPCVVEVGLELLAAHYDVTAAVAFAECYGYFGYRGFAVSEKQLGALVDNGVVLLTCSGKEARHVDEGNDGDVEAVAEAHETGGLARGVAVEHTGVYAGLVGHHAYALSVKAGEADDDVAGKVALNSRNSPLSTTAPMTLYMS